MAAATEISIYDAVTVDSHFHIKRRTGKAFLDIFAFLPMDLGKSLVWHCGALQLAK